jgi:hypothetical protein
MSPNATGITHSLTHSGRPPASTRPFSRFTCTIPTLAYARSAAVAADTAAARTWPTRRSGRSPRSSAVESVRCLPSRVATSAPTNAIQSVSCWT